MAHTAHGHAIPGSGDTVNLESHIACGGVFECTDCIAESAQFYYDRLEAQKSPTNVIVEREEGILGDDCGHHCGVITTGKHQHEGHCKCPECHGSKEK